MFILLYLVLGAGRTQLGVHNRTVFKKRAHVSAPPKDEVEQSQHKSWNGEHPISHSTPDSTRDRLYTCEIWSIG